MSSVSFAAIPEPKSGGKFVQSKGTKAQDDYQQDGRAGGAPHEPGSGLLLGSLLLKPYVGYRGQWEDNIFYDASVERSDYIHRLDTGVDAELPLAGGQHILTGTFSESLEWFDRFDENDHADYTLGGGLDLSFVPFSLKMSDTHQRTVSRSDTEFTTRIDREENVASGLLEIPFAAFFLETEALNFNTSYRDPVNEPFDHNELTLFQRVGMDLSPATQVLAEYGYVNIDYANLDTRNGDANQVSGGLRGNMSDRITYQAWVGSQWRIYDEDIRPDFNGVVVRSAIQYDISEASNIGIKYARDPQESTFDGQSFYIRDKVSAVWRQQVLERVFLNVDGALSANKYSRITVLGGQQETRKDNVWDAGVGLDYMMPNDLISLYCEYRHEDRVSTLDGLDYGNNVLNFGIKAAY